jgi:hypothetical protein
LANSSGRSNDIRISKGTFIFVLFDVRAALSMAVFSLPGVWADDGSDDVGYTSGGCTTLPSLQANVIQLDIVVTFIRVAVKEPVEAIDVLFGTVYCPNI